MAESRTARSLLEAENMNHLWAQLLVEELVRCGVEVFFLAPGSRSTPLTTAVARHPTARAVMHYDERGTAFAALGYGRATGRPAGWITTSGTAVANGLPAVVEAATDGVPMLLLTADRPPELRDTGANQTIDQVKVFGAYARWQFDLPAPTTDIAPQMVLTTAGQAVHRARRVPPGPVHLNCMFRKPLAPDADGADRTGYTADLADWAKAMAPYTRYPAVRPSPEPEEVNRLAETLGAVECGLVVAGRLSTDGARRAVARLAGRLGWPLVPDVTSGLRFGAWGASDARIAHADPVLASAAFREAHRPEAVLHVGGRFVSKRLQQYLEAVRPAHHIVLRPDPARHDPGHQATQHVEGDVRVVCAALLDSIAERAETSGWKAAWQAAERTGRAQVEAFVQEASALSEPLVARLVTRDIPAEHALVLASSMPVRDANRFGDPAGAAVPVFANRGASGIDGTVATAAGVAAGREAPVTLVTGDLALLHDLNSLALLRTLPVVVVAINNDGGGIFHFLPIAEHADVFEPYFATPHRRSFEDAAAMFDLEYARPETADAFIEAYRAACAGNRSALIEVRTERQPNRALHEALERRIAEAVTAVVGGGCGRGANDDGTGDAEL